MKSGFLYFRWLIVAAVVLLAIPAESRDWYVHLDSGSDDNNGSQSAPMATAQVAVNAAQNGDRILLFPEDSLYRQSITFRGAQAGIVIEGNGVTLTGSDPLDPSKWESLGEDLQRMRLPATRWDRHLLIKDGRAERMGRLCQNPIDFPAVEDLKPGQFRWDAISEEEGWLTYRGDTAGLEWSTRENGIATSGEMRNLKVFNLISKHFLNDGFNIHGNARGMQFFNVAGFENFDEGFSAHDTSTCWIKSGKFFGNENAIADVNEADTYYEDCEFGHSAAVEALFQGGRHSLTRCKIITGSRSIPLSIQAGNSSHEKAKTVAASLVMREIQIDASATSQKRWNVGAGSTVFIDSISSKQVSKLSLSQHPTSRISRDLYRVRPIGRSNDGTPIMTWVGGGTGAPRSSSYRIIHFDKHEPDQIAEKISPENDWLGLMTPLPKVSFPPTGPAFQPENEAAHAIWRWIGLTAPHAVFLPDTPVGLSLAAALRSEPPAGVGMVDVFVASRGKDGKMVSSVVSKGRENLPSADSEMNRRLGRSPREVMNQLSLHYGNQFDGSYIDALALIAKLRADIDSQSIPLARASANDSLPKSGGQIAGTLLYAEIDEEWARARVRKVANLGFDETGTPLEAMPFHNEMSDAIFMAGPLLARTGELTGETRYFDQCVRNVRFIRDLCLRDDGIYRHSPLSEAAWGRGNGFPALGIAMILDHFPQEHPDREFLVTSIRSHLEALAYHQGTDGMWHQLIDLPDSYAEFTCTCMIAYSIARGIDAGWLEADVWSPRLLQAWEGIKTRIDTDGRSLCNVCTGTGKQKTLEAYYRREAILGPNARGGAMALLLAEEMIRYFEPSTPR